jgi:hypothetical protein
MQLVTNQNASGATVYMDGTFYLKCRFTKCTLLYAGGDYGWEDCVFDGCTVKLAGSAIRVREFLGHCHLLKESSPDAPQNIVNTGGLVH